MSAKVTLAVIQGLAAICFTAQVTLTAKGKHDRIAGFGRFLRLVRTSFPKFSWLGTFLQIDNLTGFHFDTGSLSLRKGI